jgi:hypothetical protein
MKWYDFWKALSFTRSFLQAECQGNPDTHEIDKLLEVAQYMARLNTIIVDSSDGTADMSLVDPDMACDPDVIQYGMENWKELVEKSEEVTEVEVN